MQQEYYNSYYQHQYPQFPNLNPTPPPPAVANPTDPPRNTYASAPSFNEGYGSADYSQNYPPYVQSTDHVPPSAPAAQHPPPSPPATSLNPNSYSSFNQPPTIHPPAPSYGSFDSTSPYQQSNTQPLYYPPYDQHPPPSSTSAPNPNHVHAPPYDQHQSSNYPPLSSASAPNPYPLHAPPYSSSLYYAPPYSGGGSSMPHSYEKPYDKPVKFDQPAYGDYGRSISDLVSDLYGKRSESGGYFAFEDSYGDGVYAYEGSKFEPYGSRGTVPKSTNSTLFYDCGRPISMSSGRDSSAGAKSAKVVRAVPRLM